MPDRRSVDELSIEELEQILAIRRAEARAERMRRLRAIGRLPESSRLPDGALAAVEGRASGAPLGESDPHRRRWGAALEPASAKAPPQSRARGGLRKARDRALLVLEVAALVGLVVVLAGALTSFKTLNQEASQASGGAASAPTAVAPEQYLPSGHTAPDSRGSSVPLHLRDRVQAAPQVAIPIPTPGPQAPTRIVIPAIGVDAEVVEGDDWEQLKYQVGHHLHTANPGQRGNLVLSAHNDIYGKIFRDLDELDLEDEVVVYAGEQSFTYRVKATRIVAPTEVSVMAPTTRPVVTLISCYPYLVDTHRIVVIGELE
jgi:sortase A